ncbi:8947_t:CDS:1 [Racocetra persica]|uniref:8947_t:CDS:1 n=1 Tax=Racocetra persica TaxID=160502 RepID=A0ACA9KSU7_9GLOM|nr:8947_t:CDS:1 [Racocetra persica]
MESLISNTSNSDKLKNKIDYETDDLAFDDDIRFINVQEEEKEGFKKRNICINMSTDTTNIRFKIKNALYNALLYYWNLLNDKVLLACLLDPRYKKLYFAIPNQ